MNIGSDGPDPSLSAQRTSRNVRVVMVAALVALTVAVLDQTAQQGFLLGSISAYYYTPAQAIFVGTLVGLGIAMIALRGTNDVEDVLLNLAGVLAPVIALVPTSRGADFQAARKACESAGVIVSGAQAGPGGQLDCPTIRAIVAANRANVQNNMLAYLVTGALALAFAWYLVSREAGAARGRRGAPLKQATLWSVGAATAMWLVAVALFVWGFDWLVGNAHFVAATGLFALIVAVVVANAFRRSGVTGPVADRRWRRVGHDTRSAFAGPGRWYGAYAILMVVLTAIVVLLWAVHAVSFFWVEFTVIALFALFWIGQTREQYLDTIRRSADALTAPARPRGDVVT